MSRLTYQDKKSGSRVELGTMKTILDYIFLGNLVDIDENGTTTVGEYQWAGDVDGGELLRRGLRNVLRDYVLKGLAFLAEDEGDPEWSNYTQVLIGHLNERYR